jgi:hypothetical protein
MKLWLTISGVANANNSRLPPARGSVMVPDEEPEAEGAGRVGSGGAWLRPAQADSAVSILSKLFLLAIRQYGWMRQRDGALSYDRTRSQKVRVRANSVLIRSESLNHLAVKRFTNG